MISDAMDLVLSVKHFLTNNELICPQMSNFSSADPAPRYEVHVLFGMPRAGTTFLYHNLKNHPELFLPFRRKTNYFAVHYKKPVEFFFDHFAEKKDDQCALDTDTLCFLNDEAYARFVTGNKAGQSKIILVVRDPASWALSLYKQISSFSTNMPSFEKYLTDGYTLIEDGAELPFHFADGKLKERLTQLRADFGGRLLVLPFSKIEHEPEAFLRKIESFLNVSAHHYQRDMIAKKINAADKNSNRFIAWLLRQNWLINFLKVLPRGFVLWAREKYDILLSKGREHPSSGDPVDARLAFSQAYYIKDMEFFADLEARLVDEF